MRSKQKQTMKKVDAWPGRILGRRSMFLGQSRHTAQKLQTSTISMTPTPPPFAPSPLTNIPDKEPRSTRLVTFNINGFRTLFQYHPWTTHRNLSSIFNALKADIITFQELKLQKSDVNDKVARVEGYQTFITVPSCESKKKGYAGVSVHVRIPKEEESEETRLSLRVMKAEEGITGILKSPDTGMSYKNSPEDQVIGGYVTEFDDLELREIDGEGRAIVLELARGIVVISVYCPANSIDTEEGEAFRVKFITILFQRIRNLHALGKEVILMGDINIARDLIDSAVCISELLKTNSIAKTSKEVEFESVNKDACLEFTSSTIPRAMLNALLSDSVVTGNKTGIMTDTTRKHQGRKHKLYTVWNTLTNARPSNFGSRIDLILATSKLDSINGNIWPALMGSDHCPVYTDFLFDGLETQNARTQPEKKLPFEAVKFYKLGRQGALDMLFGGMKKRKLENEQIIEPESTQSSQGSLSSSQGEMKCKNALTSTIASNSNRPSIRTKSSSKKPQQATLTQFFKKPKTEQQPEPTSSKALPTQPLPSSANSVSLKLANGRFQFPTDKPAPQCKHNLPCVLKTSRNESSKGKKFWSCSKPLRNGGDGLTLNDERNGTGVDDFSCNFFQWK